jgi:hypothetical protein
MKKTTEKLNKIFDIEVETNESSEIVTVDAVETEIIKDEDKKPIFDRSPDIKKDYEYTRGNLYSIIEKGQEAIDGILEVAQDSEEARPYEVVGQLIKSVSDATDKLIDLQQKMKNLEKEDEKSNNSPQNVTNALFVGSTAELSKLLKNAKNK